MALIEIIYRHASAATLVSVGFVCVICDQTTSFTVSRMFVTLLLPVRFRGHKRGNRDQ